MGIVSKLFPRDENAPKARSSTAQTDWIDLSDYQTNEKPGEAAHASTWVRFAPLRALDDLKHYATYVYDGNILILDFSAVQNDEILLRRLTNELRKIAQDTGGDLAGLGDHHILLTPSGIKVDRKKLSGKVEGEDDAQQNIPRTSYTPQTAPAPAPAAAPAPSPASAASGGSVGRRMNGAGRAGSSK